MRIRSLRLFLRTKYTDCRTLNTEPMRPDCNRIIYEGWTAKDFIAEPAIQAETVMRGESRREPFRTKKELTEWCRENQPYYKKRFRK